MSKFAQYVLGSKLVSRPSGEGYDSQVLPGALTATIFLLVFFIVGTACLF